jgi:hypothetical protein
MGLIRRPVQWKKSGLCLKAVNSGLSEKDIDPIADWCQVNACGRRTSFDTFQFDNKKQMSFFLLRWLNDNN